MADTTGVLEGWKAIGAALGISSSSSAALRKRLHGWELEEGLPVHRVRRRVFATVIALQAWSGNVAAATSPIVTSRNTK